MVEIEKTWAYESAVWPVGVCQGVNPGADSKVGASAVQCLSRGEAQIHAAKLWPSGTFPLLMA